jgi:hypothetical protein
MERKRTLAGRYDILGTLGTGGMATVYRCSDRSLGVECAIKEFEPPRNAERMEWIEQFQLEAQLLALLRHSALPRVTDFFVEGDRFFLVMDVVVGESLRDILERQQAPQPIIVSVGWLVELLDVVSYLHRQEPPVLFRDFSPGNVMIENGHVKLIDFGLARLHLPEQQTRPALRGYGSSGYAPPEQYGTAHTDQTSDLYGVAALGYHLFTGRPPADAVAIMMGRERLEAAHKVNPHLPVELAIWVSRGMAIKPEHRFSSAGVMLTALREAVAAAQQAVADGEDVSASVGLNGVTDFVDRLWHQLRPHGWQSAAEAVPHLWRSGLRRLDVFVQHTERLSAASAADLRQQAEGLRRMTGVLPTTTFFIWSAQQVDEGEVSQWSAARPGWSSIVVLPVELSSGRVWDEHARQFCDTNRADDFLLNLRIAAHPPR